MKNNSEKSYASHREMFQLLPWYVNKTLNGNELKALETHLTVCLVCKRELIQLEKLAQAVVKEDALDSIEKASFARLKKRLHQNLPGHSSVVASPVTKSDIHNNVFEYKKPENFSRFATLPMRSVLALAAVLLIALIIPLHMTTNLNAVNDFRTLSDTEAKDLSADEIRVVFAEGATTKKINSILKRINADLVDKNPTDQGVYTVKLNNTGAAKVLDTLSLLKQDENVIFAEPAYALLSSTHHGGEK